MFRKWKKRFRKQVLVEFKCCITVNGLRLKQITMRGHRRQNSVSNFGTENLNSIIQHGNKVPQIPLLTLKFC